MNKLTIIKNIHKSYVAGEGVVFIKTDDTPRVLSLLNEVFKDKTSTTYSSSREFHVRGNYNHDDSRGFDTFKHVMLGAGDVKEDILILQNLHTKLNDDIVDIIVDIVLYGDNSTFLIFIVPLDYTPPREMDMVNSYTLSNPDSKEIESELYSIFENKTKLFNKLDLIPLIESLLGLPLYKIQRFFKYELSENEQLIKSDGTNYLLSQLEDHRFSHINSIEGLSLMSTDGVVIAGNEDTKKKIDNFSKLIELNNKGYKLSKPKGLLLHGSAGVGKTQFAKYIAKELNNPLIKLDLAGVYNKWLGTSEERMVTILSFINSIGNCTVLIDEIHLVFDTESKTEDTTNRLLGMIQTYMSECDNNVVFVFTANEIVNLPPALTRKGRLDYIIEISLPDTETRKSIANIYLNKNGFEIDNLNLFLKITEGTCGADIEWYVEQAILQSVIEEKELTEHILVDIVRT